MPVLTPFRLLDLPLELHDLISQLVFENHVTKIYKCSFLASLRSRGVRSPAPGLLLASKQVYHEAVDLFWHSTTVVWSTSFTP